MEEIVSLKTEIAELNIQLQRQQEEIYNESTSLESEKRDHVKQKNKFKEEIQHRNFKIQNLEKALQSIQTSNKHMAEAYELSIKEISKSLEIFSKNYLLREEGRAD